MKIIIKISNLLLNACFLNSFINKLKNKETLLLPLLLIASIPVLLAQPCLTERPDLLWAKSYGGSDEEKAYSIEQTTDGGYIFAGYSYSNDVHVGANYGNTDVWIVKIDEAGNLQWEKNYGGSKWEEAYSIQQTTDGGYIVAGKTNSNDGDVGGNTVSFDYWILKLDESGNVQWEKNYSGIDYDEATSIQQTIDGGYIVAGRTDMSNIPFTSSYNYWILKLDALGNLQWEKDYGGSEDDIAKAIIQTIDGGYIVAGVTESSNGDVSHNNGSIDCWIVKLDQLGNLEWEKSYGGTKNDGAYSIQQTIDGGYICAGYTASNDGDIGGNNGHSDCWIIKLDESGNLVWENNYGDLYHEYAQSIKQTVDGGYICAGGAEVLGSYNYWIIKLDEAGNIQAEQKYGGSRLDRSYSITQTTNGDYTVVGYTRSIDGDICESFGSEELYKYDVWILNLNGDCFSAFEITEDTPFQNLYTSCGGIATSGNLMVQQNQQVQYCANRVRLKEGFSVAAGADFKVRVSGCD